MDDFINAWEDSDKKQAIIDELEDKGVLLEELQNQLGEDMDPFDLICHVAFDKPPLTRRERANNVKKRDIFTKYGEKAREVISLLLDKYADNGIEAIEDINVLKVDPFSNI
jgi:type I restriction enzyme R subunit